MRRRRRRGIHFRRASETPRVTVEPVAVVLAIMSTRTPLSPCQAAVPAGDHGMYEAPPTRFPGRFRLDGIGARSRGQDRQSERER
jgi:hypothetical protein